MFAVPLLLLLVLGFALGGGLVLLLVVLFFEGHDPKPKSPSIGKDTLQPPPA